MTTDEPAITTRPEQPYLAIRGRVTLATFPAIADRMPELFGLLAARGLQPAGPPFFRYRLFGHGGELEVEAGVPVDHPVPGDGDLLADVLPAGRYATLTHVGTYDGLGGRVEQLMSWAAERDLAWDVTPTDHGQRWGCRLDVLRTSPAVEPDPARWTTDLVFRLAGPA